MKNTSFVEICEFYQLMENSDLTESPKFPGRVDPQLLADLYLYYEDKDLDILANREYFVSELPSFEVFESVLKSDVWKRLSSNEEKAIEYYGDPEILCDAGILKIVESFCTIGLETVESCSGLHLRSLDEMSMREKYEAIANVDFDLGVYPHLTFASPDAFSSVFFTKLISKIQNTGGLFRISFDCGLIHLEMEELPKSSTRWNSLLKAVYFWRSLEMLMAEILSESKLDESI